MSGLPAEPDESKWVYGFAIGGFAYPRQAYRPLFASFRN